VSKQSRLSVRHLIFAVALSAMAWFSALAQAAAVLTSGASAAGFTLSTFVDQIPNFGANTVGPVGILSTRMEYSYPATPVAKSDCLRMWMHNIGVTPLPVRAVFHDPLAWPLLEATSTWLTNPLDKSSRSTQRRAR
jgi:hypothetical protein